MNSWDYLPSFHYNGLKRCESRKIVKQANAMFHLRRKHWPEWQQLQDLSRQLVIVARKSVGSEVQLVNAANDLYYLSETIIGFGPYAKGFDVEITRRAMALVAKKNWKRNSRPPRIGEHSKIA